MVENFRFGFLLKTYSGDFTLAERLINSFNIHNIDSLPLFVVVPEEDFEHFLSFTSSSISVLSERSIPSIFADAPINGIRPGYINQQIVKLSFHRLNLLDAYLCLDADARIITDFRRGDFVLDNDRCYATLVEDRELKSNREYFLRHWKDRDSSLNGIRRYLGLETTDSYLTCHGFQILESQFLRLLEERVLSAQGLDFIDLLRISPYEFSWYNFFIERERIPTFAREPYFKTFHDGDQLAFAKLQGQNLEDLARGYLGIVVNSNFSIIKNVNNWGLPPAVLLALYTPFRKQVYLFISSFLSLVVSITLEPLRIIRKLSRSKQKSLN